MILLTQAASPRLGLEMASLIPQACARLSPCLGLRARSLAPPHVLRIIFGGLARSLDCKLFLSTSPGLLARSLATTTHLLKTLAATSPEH